MNSSTLKSLIGPLKKNSCHNSHGLILFTFEQESFKKDLKKTAKKNLEIERTRRRRKFSGRKRDYLLGLEFLGVFIEVVILPSRILKKTTNFQPSKNLIPNISEKISEVPFN